MTRTRSIVALASALALAGAAGRAAAATKHRALLGIGAEERYDDDARVSGAGALMTKLSPEVGYGARNERLELEARYGPDFIHHTDGNNFTVDHRARAELRDRLSERLTLRATGLFYRVEDTSTLPRFGVARTVAGALWLRSDASLKWAASHTLSLEGGYGVEATRLFTGGLPLGVVHAGTLVLMDQVTERLSVGGGYRAQLFTADLAPFAHAHALTGRLRYRLTRHAFAAAEAGPLLYLADGGRSPVLRANLELGYAARGVELGIVGGRDVVGAAGFADAVWADYLQAAAAWRLSRSVSLYGAGGAFRNGLAPDQPVTAQGFNVSTGVEWRLWRGLAASANFDHIGQLDVGGAGLGLARNIFSVRMGWQPLR